ncbi:Zinc finger, RING/FYVE/PHD-type, partial [Cynara cardunculus var. scolymus]
MEEGNESEQISDHFICAFVAMPPASGVATTPWMGEGNLIAHYVGTQDEEQKLLAFSPDVDHLVTGEELDHPSIGDQPSDLSCEDNLLINSSPSEETKSNDGSSAENGNRVTVADVLCTACRQLLYRPVVLNCGHVYCEACITIPEDGVIKCRVCEGRHPNGVPSICKELDYFLEEQFSSEYALRRSSMQPYTEQIRNGNPFKDCKEKSGYDVCGDCHKTGSKLPGRFNQKHTSEHRLVLVKPVINRDVIYRLLSGQLAVVSAARNRSNESSEFASSSIDDDDGGGGGGGGGGG